MTDCSKQVEPLLVFTGDVTRYEASGARGFQFNLSDGQKELSFLLRSAPDTSDQMFVTMSVSIALAYSTKTQVEVTCYDQLDSGVYYVNIIRGA